MFHRTRTLLMALFGAIGMVLAVAGTTAASAGNPLPTPACEVMNPNCAEPVVAQSADPTQDLNPLVNFAMTYLGPNPNTGAVGGKVFIATNNNITGALSGTQDWTFDTLGLVPTPGTFPPFPYGLTANDLQNYGTPGDQATLAQIEYTPFGQSSPFCLAINNSSQAVLHLCSQGRNEVFIIDDDPPLLNESPTPYNYALLVKHAPTAQGHLCLTAPTAPLDLTGQLDAERCAFAGPGIGTDQMWAAIR